MLRNNIGTTVPSTNATDTSINVSKPRPFAVAVSGSTLRAHACRYCKPHPPLAMAAADQGHAGEDKDDHIGTQASQCLRKYGCGTVKVKLEDLGTSPLNRLVSAKHVHSLGLNLPKRA